MNHNWFYANLDKQVPMWKLYIKESYTCQIMVKGKECWLIIMKTIWNWCHLSEVNVFLQEATYSPWGHTTISMISIRKIVSTIQYFLPPILSITNIASIWSFNTTLEDFDIQRFQIAYEVKNIAINWICISISIGKTIE